MPESIIEYKMENRCGFSWIYPPASKAGREVANLTEENPPTPVFVVKEFVRQSVINFDPNYLRTGRTE